MTDYEDVEERSVFDWKSVIFFVIGSLVWVFLIRRDAGEYICPKGWTEVFALGLIVMSGLFPLWFSRYWMPHVAVDGASGSFDHNKSPRRVEDFYVIKDPSNNKAIREKFIWLVYGLGASNIPGVRAGMLETLIVPEKQIDIRAKNHYGSTHVDFVPLKRLSPPLHDFFFFRHPGEYNVDKIKIGFHDVSFVPKHEFDDADKDLHIQQLQSQVNSRSKMLSGDFQELEKTKRALDVLNPQPGTVDKIISVFKRSPDADKQQ